MLPLHSFLQFDSTETVALHTDNAAGHGDQPLPRHSGRSGGVRRSYSADDSFPLSPTAAPRRRLVRHNSANLSSPPSSPKKQALDRWASSSPMSNRWAAISPRSTSSPNKKTRSRVTIGGGDCPPVLPGQGLLALDETKLEPPFYAHKNHQTNARAPTRTRQVLSTLDTQYNSCPLAVSRR
jgi:hypothetical protein